MHNIDDVKVALSKIIRPSRSLLSVVIVTKFAFDNVVS